MTVTGPQVPYCGAPPDPTILWDRWNFDPVLIAALIACAGLYAIGSWRARRSGLAAPGRWQRLSFYLGWTVTTAALVSPLCALSVSLFAARIAQHMILVLIGAVLVAAGAPATCVAVFTDANFPHAKRHAHAPLRIGPAPLPAAALFAVLLWFWHAPLPYAATFASTFVYWSMHVSLYGSALWLWASLIDGRPKGAAVAAAGLLSSVQMGFLGALITLAPRLIYTPHLLTTAAWHLTPLQDQQLGGVIMWVPGCVVFLVLTLLALRLDLVRKDKAWSLGKAASP